MNIFEAYNKTKKELEEAGIEDYVFEAKQIIKHITGMSNQEILLKYNKQLSLFEENNLTALIKQRKVRYPLQYIFGEWSFYGCNFSVGPGVLIPRADTETLIDKAKELLKDAKDPLILDLCAGSGCIGITLAKEIPSAKVTMVEKYNEAMRYAEKNITLNKTENAKVISGDVFEGTESDKKYDLIVSNPPYIPENEMKICSPETKFEPETALIANDGGMEFYKAIVKNYKESLKENGIMMFEVGIGKANEVKEILKAEGFANIGSARDLNSIERAVYAFK